MSWWIKFVTLRDTAHKTIENQFENQAKQAHNSEFAKTVIRKQKEIVKDFVGNLNKRSVVVEASGHTDSDGNGNMKLDIQQIDIL